MSEVLYNGKALCNSRMTVPVKCVPVSLDRKVAVSQVGNTNSNFFNLVNAVTFLIRKCFKTICNSTHIISRSCLCSIERTSVTKFVWWWLFSHKYISYIWGMNCPSSAILEKFSPWCLFNITASLSVLWWLASGGFGKYSF